MLGSIASDGVIYFFIFFSKKCFAEYHQRVKQFVPRSGLTFWRAWSGSKLSATVNSHYKCSRQRVKCKPIAEIEGQKFKRFVILNDFSMLK